MKGYSIYQDAFVWINNYIYGWEVNLEGPSPLSVVDLSSTRLNIYASNSAVIDKSHVIVSLLTRSMWWVILTVATLITLLVLKRAHRTDRFPPVRSGWLPWLGCALEFGREPLNFINRTKDEVTH